MGLVSGIHWPHARAASTPHEPAEAAASPAQLKELSATGNEYWGARMLPVSAAIIVVFQSAYLLNELNSSGLNPGTGRIHLLNIGISVIAFVSSFNARSARHWRGTMLAMSWGVIGGTAAINVLRDEDVPLFIVALLFATGTGCLVPWSERWQAALNVFAVAAFAADEALIPAHDPYLYFRWLGMLTAVMIAQLAAHLTGLYRSRLSTRYEALAQSERRTAVGEAKLRKIFESTSDAIAIFSLVDDRTLEVNSEFSRVTGYSREEALSARHGKLPLWRNEEQRRRFVRELKDNGILRNMEAQVLNRHGALAPFLLSGSTVELDGELCAIVMARDIATLKHTQNDLVAAREQALSALRAKSEFLSIMSHEIRTPMNAVLGMAEVLSETRLDRDQLRYLEIMRFNGCALLILLDDILDLAKIESGRLRLEHTEFELGDLVEKTLETLAVRAHGKGLELIARIAPGTATRRWGDPLRLRQVLINLLGNAIKFTELGAVELTVTGESGGEAGVVRFSVADTGIGIKPAELGTIFSNFTQADSSNTRKYGGSGLGLALAARLVELMGGRVAVESEPGKGSTFHFTTPLEVSNTVSDPIPTHDLRGLSALVADRNATNRRIFVETLGECGATVAEASTVEETIAALGEALRFGRPFDLVFGDCQMPGIEQVERLAKDGCACGAAMIIPMLTTDDLNSKLARVRRLGFQSHLLKPVRRADLLEVISRAALNLKHGRAPGPRRREPATNTATLPAAPTSAPAPADLPTTTQPLRILLAEDSPDNRLLIAAYFKRLPYQVETAENGKIAVEKFISGRYDLVLMDIQMPVMDGYTAVRTIRAWETEHRRPPTPILALTASTLDNDIRRAFEVGCNTHIAKPVRKVTLLAAIDETLALVAAGAAKLAQTAPRATSGGTAPGPAQTRVNGVPH
jgi:two-component system, sensor histidine kinase and response regulator